MRTARLVTLYRNYGTITEATNEISDTLSLPLVIRKCSVAARTNYAAIMYEKASFLILFIVFRYLSMIQKKLFFGGRKQTRFILLPLKNLHIRVMSTISDWKVSIRIL